MINSLTDSQKLEINTTREEWIGLCQTIQDITINDIEKDVEHLYKLDNRKKPLILILDDPLQCQYAANILYDKNGDQINNQIENQIGNHIRHQINNQIENQIGNHIRHQIYSHIENQIHSQISDQIHKQIGDQIDSQNLRCFAELGGLSWRSWYYSTFDYYLKTGLLNIDKDLKQKLIQQIEFLKKGIWELLVFENVCIISKCPKTKRDDKDKLHSVTGKAVEFKSGYGFYAIHGVVFEYALWNKIINRKLNVKELLSLENTDQRFVAINFIVFGIGLDNTSQNKILGG